MTTANLHAAAQAVGGTGLGSHVMFLELTVDPGTDTVRRLHAYAKLYGALPGWHLATGNPTQVRHMWRALGVSTDKVPTRERVRDWMTGRSVSHPYDVHHQDVAMIIDPAGRLRWVTTGRPDATGTPLPTTMRRFLNAEGRSNYAHPRAGGAAAWSAGDIERAVAYVSRLEG